MVKPVFIILLLGIFTHAATEIDVQLLPLGAPLSSPSAQLSGLTWCGDELLLLPQKPAQLTASTPAIYSLQKKEIYQAIEKAGQIVLSAQAIHLDDKRLRTNFTGFDGYEAIVCDNHTLWLAIETKQDKKRFVTSLVKAERVTPELIRLEANVHSVVASGSGIWNFSDETLLLAGNNLLSIHEANGTIATPKATLVSKVTRAQRQIPIAPLPYRITDATRLDKHQRFWVINYLWQNDHALLDDNDWIAKKHPPGKTHRLEKSVERLLELELTESGIKRTDTPPIYLSLTQQNGRNWEGLARLDDLGLLLVSDQFPATYFGFVALP